MIKAVIFDVDGTLVDSVDAHANAWKESLSLFGYDIDFMRIRHEIGKGSDQLLPVFLDRDEIQKIGKDLEARSGEIFKKRYLPTIRGFAKVRELFEKILGDGKSIALASSSKGDELEAYKRAAKIEDLVEHETSKDDAKKSKPHPDIFVAALRRLSNVSADEVIVVGDTPYDSQAARKAGIRSIGMLSGGFPEHELSEAGCIAIYRDPADLLDKYEFSPLVP